MRYLRICVSLFLAVSIIVSCQKEKSFESDKTPARGSLHSSIDDDCSPKEIKGIFLAGTLLTADNYIEAEVEVTSPGVYNISTDTVNGYYFKGTGTFTTTGTNVIRLTASGTPVVAGTDNFFVAFDSSFCYVPVVVLPAGTGAAAFTLSGSGGNCMNAVVTGSYASGVPMTLSNKVDIRINVTQIGTYNITTTAVNGMVFSGSGVLTATGQDVITLTASGTPSATGETVVTVTAGSSSCTFSVTVGDLSVFDYFPRTTNSNWSYEWNDDVNDSLLRVALPATVSINGNTYNEFVETDDAVAGTNSSRYFRKSGGSYYEYMDASFYLGFDAPALLDYIFLKDDVNSGTSWTTNTFSGSISGSPQITLRMKLAILEKDVSVTVKGTAYPNTIVVDQRFEINAGGTWAEAPYGSIKSYYARNIGLIKQEAFDGLGNLLDKSELRRHEVY